MSASKKLALLILAIFPLHKLSYLWEYPWVFQQGRGPHTVDPPYYLFVAVCFAWLFYTVKTLLDYLGEE